MKKIIGTIAVAVGVLGLAACTTEEPAETPVEETPVVEEAPRPESEDVTGYEEEPTSSVVTLGPGDSHTVQEDIYGDSYTVTVEDIRFYDELYATEYVAEGERITAYDGEGYFAVVDMTYVNDGTDMEEFIQIFDAYETPDGEILTSYSQDNVTPDDPDGYNILSPSDVESEMLLEDASVPPGSRVSASEVIVVPDNEGYVYSYDGTFRISLGG